MMAGELKPLTSTFVIDHERCRPQDWHPDDVLAFAEFLRYGNMSAVARLSGMGVLLVASEKLALKGGTLEHVGWGSPADAEIFTKDLADAVENIGGHDITALCRIYREKPVYVARYAVGTDGDFDGYDYEVLNTEEEAGAYPASLTPTRCDATADDGEGGEL